jgi:hypothetical protein
MMITLPVEIFKKPFIEIENAEYTNAADFGSHERQIITFIPLNLIQSSEFLLLLSLKVI